MQSSNVAPHSNYTFPAALPERRVQVLFTECFLLLCHEARVAQHFTGAEYFQKGYDVVDPRHSMMMAILVPCADFERIRNLYPRPERFVKFEMKNKGAEGYAVLSFKKKEWYEGGEPEISKVTVLPHAKLGAVTTSLEKKHKERREREAHHVKKYDNGSPTGELILTDFIEFDDLSSAARFLAGSPQAGSTYFNPVCGRK